MKAPPRSSSATIFALKMQLAFAVWKRRDLSPAARLVFTVLLVGHHNVLTGKCNPSYETLAKECSAKDRRSIMRSIAMLKRKGIVAVTVLSISGLVSPRAPFKGSEKVSSVSPFKPNKRCHPLQEKVTPVSPRTLRTRAKPRLRP